MNLREGTRRLALLLGALGIIAGGFASYVELQTVLPMRAAHRNFEQLANSQVVQQERKTLQSPPKDFLAGAIPLSVMQPTDAHGKGINTWPRDPGLPSRQVQGMGKLYAAELKPVPKGSGEAAAPDTLPGDFFDKQDAAPDTLPGDFFDGQPSVRPGTAHPEMAGTPQDNASISATPSAPEVDWSTSIPLPSKVRKDGIETINWSHDYRVASIETEDGQTLYPTPAPSAWRYLLIAIFPILGFFIPWGAIRAIVWVGEGFVNPAK